MVLYGVYSEPLFKRHYSTICSRATLFQAVAYALILVPPFFIAYATNDLWQYVSSYREQPEVRYLNRLIVILGGGTEGEVGVWSSFPNLNALLQPDELLTPRITSFETDTDHDRKQDMLNLTVEFPALTRNVSSVQLLLFFHVQLSLFSSVTMQSVAYFSQAWSSPVHKVWLGGELSLNQRVPLPASGRYNRYNESLFNTSGLFARDFQLTSILSQYNERNLTTVLSPVYPVWEYGTTGGVTVQAEIRYTVQTILYHPGFWQLIKFAWVQYLAIMLLFWWVIKRVQSFVFQNQIIITVKEHSD